MTYVATYGHHARDGVAYLTTTFPLPFANLTGILRVENVAGDGLRLSSYPAPDNADDAGLYLAIRGVPIRLPLDETLDVTPTADGVAATHEIRALGVRLVTLEYDIQPAA